LRRRTLVNEERVMVDHDILEHPWSVSHRSGRRQKASAMPKVGSSEKVTSVSCALLGGFSPMVGWQFQPQDMGTFSPMTVCAAR